MKIYEITECVITENKVTARRFKGFFEKGDACKFIYENYGINSSVSENWLKAVKKNSPPAHYAIENNDYRNEIEIVIEKVRGRDKKLIGELLGKASVYHYSEFPEWLEKNSPFSPLDLKIDKRHRILLHENATAIRIDKIDGNAAYGILRKKFGKGFIEFEYRCDAEGGMHVIPGMDPVEIAASEDDGIGLVAELASIARDFANCGIKGLRIQVGAEPFRAFIDGTKAESKESEE